MSSHRHLRCATVQREAAYGFIERVLKVQQYRRLLRNSAEYGRIRVRVQHEQARPVAIGERRQPNPQERPASLATEDARD